MKFKIFIISIILLFSVLIIFQLFKKRKRRPPLPPEQTKGWTNNTIRKQGKSGEGIR